MGKASMALAADVGAVAEEVTAPAQSTSSSRVSFSISPVCISEVALSSTLRSAYPPGTASCWLCSQHKAFSPFSRALEFQFLGGSVRCGVEACRGY